MYRFVNVLLQILPSCSVKTRDVKGLCISNCAVAYAAFNMHVKWTTEFEDAVVPRQLGLLYIQVVPKKSEENIKLNITVRWSPD